MTCQSQSRNPEASRGQGGAGQSINFLSGSRQEAIRVVGGRDRGTRRSAGGGGGRISSLSSGRRKRGKLNKIAKVAKGMKGFALKTARVKQSSFLISIDSFDKTIPTPAALPDKRHAVCKWQFGEKKNTNSDKISLKTCFFGG